MSSTEMKRTGFVDAANMSRRRKPKDWVIMVELVEGKMVSYKAYGTWVQKMTIEGCPYSFQGPMDCNVTRFKQFIDETLSKYL